jgi:YfiH family protein
MKTIGSKGKEIVRRRSKWLYKELGELPVFLSPLLTRHGELSHAFTTRLGGSSKPPFESFNVGSVDSAQSRKDLMSNRARLCKTLGATFERLVVPDMSHSDVVAVVQGPGPRPKADGIVTEVQDIPVLLTFADCVPVIIFDPANKVVAVLHAGWRGTASNIAGKAVRLLQRQCGSKAGDLVAAIGPAIGSCCYPTGIDVANALLASMMASLAESNAGSQAKGPQAPSENEGGSATVDAFLAKINEVSLEDFFLKGNEKVHPDLKSINAWHLYQAGVSQIDLNELCTACRPELFYSHRQSGGQTGRQGAIACLS